MSPVTDLRRIEEDEFIEAIGGQFLAVEGLPDANPMVGQQLLVDGKDLQASPRRRCREDLQRRRVAGNDRRAKLRQPARLAKVDARFCPDISGAQRRVRAE